MKKFWVFGLICSTLVLSGCSALTDDKVFVAADNDLETIFVEADTTKICNEISTGKTIRINSPCKDEEFQFSKISLEALVTFDTITVNVSVLKDGVELSKESIVPQPDYAAGNYKSILQDIALPKTATGNLIIKVSNEKDSIEIPIKRM